MAYLLRTLLIIMFSVVLMTVFMGLHWLNIDIDHRQFAIMSYLFTLFVQAFVMFYFIGISRLVKNVYTLLDSEKDLDQLFDEAPADLKPYKEKTYRFVQDSDRFKRQTIPWTMLMIILGAIAFLLGGAYDTNMVQRTTHSGVAYGFVFAMVIGFFRQWFFLGKGHLLLRKLKYLFSIPDGQM
ncbi:MAG: hypothetical protein COW00_03135 [Bdellovibrio sp. CG12_big_fil_rev_8_21_14_0_65_39_13]|nr:MAG: hypothetical protein COW78_19260 [Bdellovibrio sp. CG22_combo_CG10-13_8_21_14_all_39_27]PIQ61686.1 MAG: hypothetical protein COW00_03135 [Bdellovibrio sp. CG12_big_fil_rev_8_21_14_0_65_39_13]PIR35629.1 MAG: hypothetical protein COV37_07520 [Bdellovibrio sp. CG11_big_fil_rev_8_21_14_0_20_39_38]PJB53421.1 MAG: hypothetical protein CO099_07200 [Bdellovibrio sp. CG_4_9_14_3_um_filter_39_7]